MEIPIYFADLDMSEKKRFRLSHFFRFAVDGAAIDQKLEIERTFFGRLQRHLLQIEKNFLNIMFFLNSLY